MADRVDGYLRPGSPAPAWPEPEELRSSHDAVLASGKRRHSRSSGRHPTPMSCSMSTTSVTVPTIAPQHARGCWQFDQHC